jgi:hypothetical protein
LLLGHSLVRKLRGGEKVGEVKTVEVRPVKRKPGEIETIGEVQFRYIGQARERVYGKKVNYWRCRICMGDFEEVDLTHHAGFEIRSRAYNEERARLLREAYD